MGDQSLVKYDSLTLFHALLAYHVQVVLKHYSQHYLMLSGSLDSPVSLALACQSPYFPTCSPLSPSTSTRSIWLPLEYSIGNIPSCSRYFNSSVERSTTSSGNVSTRATMISINFYWAPSCSRSFSSFSRP